ncbi:hypothetical protein DPEC_G00072910 [Dallia pectoralis]|uniref:Uncharacterized protein n=1 Tax=Dallia pectoralis TaxID=75939 RepID=A0ACC2H3C8_DALPE|nr:hypothetical protein DPEC_G00072910 [Dallia pectoralis]
MADSQTVCPSPRAELAPGANTWVQHGVVVHISFSLTSAECGGRWHPRHLCILNCRAAGKPLTFSTYTTGTRCCHLQSFSFTCNSGLNAYLSE